jgi:hypothetical protein
MRIFFGLLIAFLVGYGAAVTEQVQQDKRCLCPYIKHHKNWRM